MNKGKKTRYSIGIGIVILSVAMIFIMSNLGKFYIDAVNNVIYFEVTK